jgi:hypothetical protein
VYPYVIAVKGIVGYGCYMLGSMQPMTLDPAVAKQVLERPGVLADISGAFDSPETTIDGWLALIKERTWYADDALRTFAGDGPMITDDHPRPEYFLLRELNEDPGE